MSRDRKLSKAEKILLEMADEGDWSLRDTLVGLNVAELGWGGQFPDWRALRPMGEATVRQLLASGLIELFRRGKPAHPLVLLSVHETEVALRDDRNWILDWEGSETADLSDEDEVVFFATEEGMALYQSGATLE